MLVDVVAEAAKPKVRRIDIQPWVNSNDLTVLPFWNDGESKWSHPKHVDWFQGELFYFTLLYPYLPYSWWFYLWLYNIIMVILVVINDHLWKYPLGHRTWLGDPRLLAMKVSRRRLKSSATWGMTMFFGTHISMFGKSRISSMNVRSFEHISPNSRADLIWWYPKHGAMALCRSPSWNHCRLMFFFFL